MILKDWQKIKREDIAINIIPRLCSSICFFVKVLLGLWTKLCQSWQVVLLGFCSFLMLVAPDVAAPTWVISSILSGLSSFSHRVLHNQFITKCLCTILWKSISFFCGYIVIVVSYKTVFFLWKKCYIINYNLTPSLTELLLSKTIFWKRGFFIS